VAAIADGPALVTDGRAHASGVRGSGLFGSGSPPSSPVCQSRIVYPALAGAASLDRRTRFI
jgi:hypothetical protein